MAITILIGQNVWTFYLLKIYEKVDTKKASPEEKKNVKNVYEKREKAMNIVTFVLLVVTVAMKVWGSYYWVIYKKIF